MFAGSLDLFKQVPMTVFGHATTKHTLPCAVEDLLCSCDADRDVRLRLTIERNAGGCQSAPPSPSLSLSNTIMKFYRTLI